MRDGSRGDSLDSLIVGREAEILAVTGLLDSPAPERALVLVGDTGIGKTTIWEMGIAAASEAGSLVLSARPATAEANFTYVGLADLLSEVNPEILERLPEPQRHALAVALLREEPGETPPGPRAVATGLLSALRELVAQQPVLVAIDDIQWLDSASAEAVSFAARRLDQEPVRFFLTRRAGEQAALEQLFTPGTLAQLQLTGLSLGAVRSILSKRLGLHLRPRVLRQIFEASGGNPLFALELGQPLAERGQPDVGDELPVPKAVADLVGDRVARLSSEVRRVLLAVALSPGVRRQQLDKLASSATVEEAIARGVLTVAGNRVRATHPLLATAARGGASDTEQRLLHRELAELVDDPERAAHHLALAADQPDTHLAAIIAAAARRAAARGATADAAELSAHAFRLTPVGTEERVERLFTFAERLTDVGERRRASDLLKSELATLATGAARATAHLLLFDTDFQLFHINTSGGHIEQALSESPLGSAVWVRATCTWARFLLVASLERIAEAEQLATAALAEASVADGHLQRKVLQTLALARVLRGKPIDDLAVRFDSVSSDAYTIRHGIERLAAERHAVRGEVDVARAIFQRLLQVARERDETWSFVWLLFQRCELELRAGNWDAASQALTEISDSPGRELIDEPAYDRCQALLAAGRGQVEEAQCWSARSISQCERRGLRWDWLEALRAQGQAALLARNAARASQSLSEVWNHAIREGIDEPGEFAVAPDLVEALLELGQIDEARAVTDRLRALSVAQEHPWGLASTTRCECLMALSQANDVDAVERLSAAADSYAALGLQFDHARTLLAGGRAARRRRMWGAARDLLDRSVAAFEAIGSTGWAEAARSESARIGGRKRDKHEQLSPTERRVAELAADGLANKEIAAHLAVSVYTVEGHLTHVYRKLGVRSRVQLSSSLNKIE